MKFLIANVVKTVKRERLIIANKYFLVKIVGGEIAIEKPHNRPFTMAKFLRYSVLFLADAQTAMKLKRRRFALPFTFKLRSTFFLSFYSSTVG